MQHVFLWAYFIVIMDEDCIELGFSGVRTTTKSPENYEPYENYENYVA